ncbi:hypothetical protein [Microtetraspora sp. NBRC 13810]|uniref:hypothetical protein n=1 Tax=Microtetraspora sp. NBRC 13810 TaxID=3030990 RepID=UPI002552F239|nr:hypothetical protein [Microtetraspora sp. NBRC 13810]
MRELFTLAHLDLAERLFDWRRRLTVLLLGPEPDLAARVRGVVAIGGLSDCTVAFPESLADELGPMAVAAALAALEGAPA